MTEFITIRSALQEMIKKKITWIEKEMTVDGTQNYTKK